MPIADSAELGKEIGGRYHISALTLHRLDYDTRTVLRRHCRPENRLFDIASDTLCHILAFPADEAFRSHAC